MLSHMLHRLLPLLLAGVPAGSVQGQMLQVPPPGAMHVTPVPAAVVPPGAVPIPAGAVVQGLPPGAVHMVSGAPLPGTPMGMAAAAAPSGTSPGMGVGVQPTGMMMAPQMTPSAAVAASAAAMGMAPPPPGVTGMMAPPGMLPVAAVPRPPMAVAGPPPGGHEGGGHVRGHWGLMTVGSVCWAALHSKSICKVELVLHTPVLFVHVL